MRLLILLLQRLVILGLGVVSVWLIVFVFEFVDSDMPLILALAATYGIAAYLILPYVVRMGLKVLGQKHIPAYTITGDGLPGDPVNLVFTGTRGELDAAFKAAGWQGADPLGLASSWRMVRAFLLNSPYPTAPFSPLYLFGRVQDVGFQKPIGDSPRKRHHVRFWALSVAYDEDVMGSADFWLNTDRPQEGERVHWVGAGTKDIGFSLTRLTFQITHATDSDTNAERDFVIAEMKASGVIGAVASYRAGDQLDGGKVNHYVTDGEVAVAELQSAQTPST